mmetsp:Transcript_2484/g.7383  ORF Transcript_2484/g.7383 Transcript_2484/m.7383 type:complete len:278 (+) Transcript_2484:222-1055(+)
MKTGMMSSMALRCSPEASKAHSFMSRCSSARASTAARGVLLHPAQRESSTSRSADATRSYGVEQRLPAFVSAAPSRGEASLRTLSAARPREGSASAQVAAVLQVLSELVAPYSLVLSSAVLSAPSFFGASALLRSLPSAAPRKAPLTSSDSKSCSSLTEASARDFCANRRSSATPWLSKRRQSIGPTREKTQRSTAPLSQGTAVSSSAAGCVSASPTTPQSRATAREQSATGPFRGSAESAAQGAEEASEYLPEKSRRNSVAARPGACVWSERRLET